MRYDSKWRGTPSLLSHKCSKADPGEQKVRDRPGKRKLQIAVGTGVRGEQMLQGSRAYYMRRKSREGFGNLA